LALFVTIFTLRYVRFIGHWIGRSLYESVPITNEAEYGGNQATVIIPTVDPVGEDFEKCIVSISKARPAGIFIVSDEKSHGACQAAVDKIWDQMGNRDDDALERKRIKVLQVARPNKREQLKKAIMEVCTPFIILADDRVTWPHKQFIASALAPFKHESIGGVAVRKVVTRKSLDFKKHKDGTDSHCKAIRLAVSAYICNFIACAYLERHN
jgi:cellulose synthase/poly-beta-1,6-N-acetylglucosamine synthase-like glycosyltransferase